MEETITKRRISKKEVVALMLASLILLSGLWMFGQSKGIIPKTTITVYAAGTPDALGNKILSFYIKQNSTGSWLDVGSAYDVDNDREYTAGMNFTIDSNVHTRFFVKARLNGTLASSTSDALSRTRIYINITGVATNQLFVSAGSYLYYDPFPTVYYRTEWWYPDITADATWIPATGTSYTITILYQAYY